MVSIYLSVCPSLFLFKEKYISNWAFLVLWMVLVYFLWGSHMLMPYPNVKTSYWCEREERTVNKRGYISAKLQFAHKDFWNKTIFTCYANNLQFCKICDSMKEVFKCLNSLFPYFSYHLCFFVLTKQRF